MRRYQAVAGMLAALMIAAGLAGAARAGCMVAPIARLPVTMVGMQPRVPVKIDGVEAMFLVDSGAFYSLISEPSAKRFGLKTQNLDGARLVGVGGTAELGVTTIKTFSLAGEDIHRLEFGIGGGETGADGILGQNVLRLADVEYDLANGVVQLMRSKGCEKIALAYWAKDAPYSDVPIEPTSANEPHTITRIKLNGVSLRAMLDTGASTSMVTIAAARRAGIRIDAPGVQPSGTSSGVGRRLVRSWIVPIDSFEIGGVKVLRTHMEVGDTDLGGAADMLLGADFFLSNRVYVANKQQRLYFTYNGGRMFNLTPLAAGAKLAANSSILPKATEPTDADGYQRRGNARLARGEFDTALADLTRARELAPGDATYAYARASLHARRDADNLALKDLDAAIAIRPGYADARLLRAGLRLKAHDDAGARADLDAADAALPKQADARLRLAQIYASADAFVPAIAQFDRWIAEHPDDSGMVSALNGRCWTRALANVALAQALKDCDRALAQARSAADVLDSRGLVRLRMGDLDRAIADYDAALKAKPDMGWSLYGRGVARARKGGKAAGEADIAAAIVADPDVAARAKRLGITP